MDNKLMAMSLIPLVAFAFLGITNFLNEASASIGCEQEGFPIPKETFEELKESQKDQKSDTSKEYIKSCKDNVKAAK